MTPTSTIDTDLVRLTPLLERQVDRYRRLRELCAQQSQLVANADSEKLLILLSQRQVLVDELGSIDKELQPYRQRWDKLAASFDDATRTRIGTLIEQVRQHLSVIMAQDEHDRASLEAAKAGIGGQLGRTRHAGDAVNAYGGAGTGAAAARYTNRQA